MTITIREHTPGKDVQPFILAGHEVFRGDFTWVPPLHFELKERLDPKKNPFFKRAEVALFTAWKGDRIVGRCSAQIDREHIEIGETTQPGEAMKNFAAGILLGRVSTPEDIIGLASFLASSNSDYITGQTIVVDGGMILL